MKNAVDKKWQISKIANNNLKPINNYSMIDDRSIYDNT